MMTKPGITELDRCVDSRYTLVSVVAKRARMIGMERNDPDSIYNPHAEKPVTQAVNEIANGIVGYVRSEAIKKAQEYEEEKLEAISMLHETLAEELSEHGGHDEHSEQSENTEQSGEAEEASEGAAPGMYDDPTKTDGDDYFGILDAALADAQAAVDKENADVGNGTADGE